MLQLHGTAFWIRRFRTLTAVRAAGKRASWASARGGLLVLLAFVAVAACETGVFDVDMGVAPASVELDVTDIDLVSGRAAVIQARVQDAKGKPINVGAGGVQIEWSSSDDWIASITPFGQAAARVTGGAAGTAEITAIVHHTVAQAGFLALLQGSSDRGGIRASSSVHVRPANLVAVAGDGQAGAVGSTLPGELIVRAVNESGQGVPNVEIQFAAQPHNGTLDPGSAVTDQEGRARTRWTLGAAAGVMKAEAGAHNRYKLTPVEFTATALEDSTGGQVAASVTVSPTAATLSTGSTQQFSAAVKDAEGVDIAEPSVTWSSSNTDVATVNASGLVTARQAGPATLTARSGDASGTAAITVQAAPTPSPPSGPIPAFPGAYGWGATALNDCRALPLAVHKVTNTNDSGSGSLRDVLENRVSDNRYDVVIFRTGGTIEQRSQIKWGRNCVYVAGQTAPGDGIMIRSHPTNGHNGLLIRQLGNRGGTPVTDIVVRYLRLRHGEEGGFGGGGMGVIGGGGAQRVVWDHISTSWGGNSQNLQIARTISGGPVTERATIQNSFIGEGTWVRGAMMNAAITPPEAQYMRRISFQRNLFIRISHRQPRMSVGYAPASDQLGIEVINNVMYAPTTRFSEAAHQSVIDFVGNYQDPGPGRSFNNGINRWNAYDKEPLDPNDPGSLYVGGNIHTAWAGDEWETWRQDASSSLRLPESFRRYTRLPPSAHPVPELTAVQARDLVLARAGASKRLTCDGSFVDARDQVDARLVGYMVDKVYVEDSRGKTVAELNGGWPTYSAGTACTDTDGDGIPDAWEIRYCGSATGCQADAVTASGYLMIEHYLNETDPTR
jgi:pectate lyase